jgi:cytochrome c oxidase cbb3-type subunit 3
VPAAALMEGSDTAAGRTIYEQTCAPCHGPTGEGGHGGGAPLVGASEPEAVTRVVRDGQNAMPPFAGALTEQQIRDVAAYVAGALAH